MREEGNVWKGMLAGAIAGLAASWAMNRFQESWSEVQQKLQQHSEAQESSGGEDATMKTVGAIGHDVLHIELSREQKESYAPLVHYAFGTATGALYGALAEHYPVVKKKWGTEFASAVFLAADELAVPALKLSKPPIESPISKHIYGWASHLVYGLSTETARRGMRAMMGNSKSKPRLSQIRATQRRAA
jgi:uncharacterized membrane protein YagU involved in acid resistance